jgi:cation diffusion facilitator CzcD-associated flavoprotein CzcO
MQTTRDGGRVAIVGGGPAGLVAANSLLEEGLHSPYLNEAQNLGGQWNAPGSHSGVWKTMRANTSKVTMCFSDFPLEEELPMFLTNQQAHAYLLKYAKHLRSSDSTDTGEGKVRPQTSSRQLPLSATSLRLI